MKSFTVGRSGEGKKQAYDRSAYDWCVEEWLKIFQDVRVKLDENLGIPEAALQGGE